jgi:chromosomal replication initiator protein
MHPRAGTSAPPSSSAEAAEVLRAVVTALRDQMSLFAYRGFIEPLLPASLTVTDEGDGPLFVLSLWAPSTFLADWVRDHYGEALTRVGAAVLGRDIRELRVVVEARPAGTAIPSPLLSSPPTTTATATSSAPVSSSLEPSTSSAAVSSAVSSLVPMSVGAPVGVLAGAPASAGGGLAPGDAWSETAGARVKALSPRRAATGDRAGAVPGRRLDPRYSFDTFVTGPGSQMAYSAAWQVAERPGARYSPLFLFGPTGLGKTHLLHAIGHEILGRHAGLRVALLSAEQWVNEFIADSHGKRFDSFRRKFRDDVDVLLIDDIQFLAGKAQSQDEFFHTFNALYEAHKQIVVTSDRYPHEIAGLEDRLKTRLQWGLVADVRPPDADTRKAILLKKAVDLGCALPHEVLDFVAASVTTSVRALEGALVRLAAYAQLTREPVTLVEAKDQLRSVLQAGAQSPVSVGRIIEVVASYHGMRSRDLTGPSRQRQVTRARQLAMYLARHHLQLSLPELGRAFGGRDHTTALASVQKIDALQKTDAGIQAVLTRLEQALF